MNTKEIGLNALKIDNFLGIKTVSMDLEKPVHIITGDNSEGKSSIRDAITTLFLGKCPNRGYTKKNQVPDMANESGGKYFSISAQTTEGSVYEMILKQGAKTVRASASPLDEALAEIATNPQSILTMKPKDRQDVFSAICQQAGAGDKIKEFLKDWPDEVIDRCYGNLDHAQDWAVEQRRTAKNQIKDLEQQSKNAPSEIVTIAGREFDLKTTTLTIEGVSEHIAGSSFKRDELIKLKGNTPKDIGDLKELVAVHSEDLKGLNREKLEYDYKDRQKEHVKATNARNEIDSVIGELNAEINVLTGKLKKLDTLGTKCPECQQDIVEVHRDTLVRGSEIVRDKATGKLAKAESKKGELSIEMSNTSTAVQAAKAELEGCDRKRGDIEQQIENLTNMIAETEQANIELEGIDDKIKKCDGAIAANTELKAAMVAYKGFVDTVGDVQAKLRDYRARIDQMDNLDAMLKPGGEIRKLVTDEIETIKLDTELAEAWNLDGLAIESDGTIAVNGRPVEALSASEQYRCGVLLAECLCRSMGIGLLILDGLEILGKENLKPLFQRMPVWIKEFGTILMLMTIDAEAKMPTAPWLSVWRMENGCIKKV